MAKRETQPATKLERVARASVGIAFAAKRADPSCGRLTRHLTLIAAAYDADDILQLFPAEFDCLQRVHHLVMHSFLRFNNTPVGCLEKVAR